MLKQLTAGSVQFGESDGDSFLHVTLRAVSHEAGTQIRQMAQGMLAFAKMSLRQRRDRGLALPMWAPLAESAETRGEGDRVELWVTVRTEDLLAMMKAAGEARQRMQDGSDQQGGSE
jgi:hypothetical protein